jgi:hypothetical protein
MLHLRLYFTVTHQVATKSIGVTSGMLHTPLHTHQVAGARGGWRREDQSCMGTRGTTAQEIMRQRQQRGSRGTDLVVAGSSSESMWRPSRLGSPASVKATACRPAASAPCHADARGSGSPPPAAEAPPSPWICQLLSVQAGSRVGFCGLVVPHGGIERGRGGGSSSACRQGRGYRSSPGSWPAAEWGKGMGGGAGGGGGVGHDGVDLDK